MNFNPYNHNPFDYDSFAQFYRSQPQNRQDDSPATIPPYNNVSAHHETRTETSRLPHSRDNSTIFAMPDVRNALYGTTRDTDAFGDEACQIGRSNRTGEWTQVPERSNLRADMFSRARYGHFNADMESLGNDLPSPQHSEPPVTSHHQDSNYYDYRYGAMSGGAQRTWVESSFHQNHTAAASSSSAKIEKLAGKWVNIQNNYLENEDSNPDIHQALRNLFFVYADSAWFRATTKTIKKEGPVSIKFDDCTNAYCIPQHRKIVIPPSWANDPGKLMSVIAFELTNLILTPKFYEVARHADNARSYAEGMERVEVRTVENMVRYYEEAQASLNRHGLGDPKNWFCIIDSYGQVRPVYQDEAQQLSAQRMMGHTGQYEIDYQRR